MSHLHDYQTAMLAADPTISSGALVAEFLEQPPGFAEFVVDHGLGPLWHARTKQREFRASRLAAEAFFIAQDHALSEVDSALSAAGIQYVVFKGAANRLLFYGNPAVRACHDIDLLVHPSDRVRAAIAIASLGFEASTEAESIDRELVLSRDDVNVDLHWSLLREGRLRHDSVTEMLASRRRVRNVWMLSEEDMAFTLLVHPAFAKHLSGHGMGLHRVADVMLLMRGASFDTPELIRRLQNAGVRTAAWATLRWLELLDPQGREPTSDTLAIALRPGKLRRAWLMMWLQHDLPGRLATFPWLRMVLFTMLLHDTPTDAIRAVRGRLGAMRRSQGELELFGVLDDQ